jgi:two-component system chemotaxis response regulator CheY
MVKVDEELAEDYLAECLDKLIQVEADLLAVEEGGAVVDLELVNRAFRAVHWINGDAGLFELVKIRVLTNQTEVVLALILSRNLRPTREQIQVLLRAVDCLRELIGKGDASNQADISEIMGDLTALCAGQGQQGGTTSNSVRALRMLLVEDDFDSRLLLQTFLCNYGECHVAVNGREAVAAFHSAMERGKRYDLICMDVMMPEMDGREAVGRIRGMEEEHGILSTHGAKIIMTTAVDDVKEVMRCFRELCDSYLTKPVDLALLLGRMRAYHLIQ